MKKITIFIASMLAICAIGAAGCTETNTGKSNEETPKTYNLVEDPNNDCKDGDCKDKNKPDFKFVRPEQRRTPPRMPHKRHPQPMPAPKPAKPENSNSP